RRRTRARHAQGRRDTGARGGPLALTAADSTAAPLLALESVTKRYGSEEALRALSLTMDGGAIGLLGPDGAGQATPLHVPLGLLAFEGEALLFGLDPRRAPAEVRARTGYMPEGDCILPSLTAVELCAYAAELSGLPHGAALDRAHQALGYVGLGD